MKDLADIYYAVKNSPLDHLITQEGRFVVHKYSGVIKIECYSQKNTPNRSEVMYRNVQTNSEFMLLIYSDNVRYCFSSSEDEDSCYGEEFSSNNKMSPEDVVDLTLKYGSFPFDFLRDIFLKDKLFWEE
jgi:hypothetical protein